MGGSALPPYPILHPIPAPPGTLILPCSPWQSSSILRRLGLTLCFWSLAPPSPTSILDLAQMCPVASLPWHQDWHHQHLHCSCVCTPERVQPRGTIALRRGRGSPAVACRQSRLAPCMPCLTLCARTWSHLCTFSCTLSTRRQFVCVHLHTRCRRWVILVYTHALSPVTIAPLQHPCARGPPAEPTAAPHHPATALAPAPRRRDKWELSEAPCLLLTFGNATPPRAAPHRGGSGPMGVVAQHLQLISSR